MAEHKSYIPANLYQQLSHSPSFYVLRIGMDGRYTYVNKAFTDKFGFLAPELIGQPYEITLHPDDIALCREASQGCMAEPDKIVPVQLRKPSAQGDYYLAYYEFSALRNQEGAVSEILCIGYDITETKLAIQEAKRNSEKFDLIIDNITDAFYILDKEWRFVKANPAFEKMVGQERKHFLGKNIWEEYPARAERIQQLYLEALEKNTSIRFEEYMPHLEKWLERTAYPSEEGLTVLIKDITERKQQEEKILDANNKLIAALNSTSDLNILISPDFTILSFNKVAADFARTFFDRPIAEGDSFWPYVPPGTQEMFKLALREAFTGQSLERKQLFSFAPGVALWYRLRFFPVFDTDNTLIGVSFNATNIDKEQRQLESLEEIASLYSQEVRRPVATIMGITRLINEDDLNPYNREWFGYLITTTHELEGVIDRIVKKSTQLE